MKDDINFDTEAAIKALREGKELSDQDGILTPLIKQLTETAMKTKLDEHLASEQKPNRQNGPSAKTMKNPVAEFELKSPRDNTGTFEPHELDRKITACLCSTTAIKASRGILWNSIACRFPTV
jgi:transposase-like protein